jgi:hypothetical protein
MDQGGPAAELTERAMDFDLKQLADRVRAAADRSEGLKATVSGFDLILSKDGYGANRSESVPFAALFLSDRDVLRQALNRLDKVDAGRVRPPG